MPFCSAICPYCDFAVQRGGPAARRRFVEHLKAEVPLAASRWAEPEPFDTIYLGGGTPSLLPPDEISRVVEACRAGLRVVPDAWILLEANPEDVTPDACAAWRALGVRTLSLGVQSFDDAELRFLGRRHDGAQARAAVRIALAAGFDTVSLDLIYGLPGQDEAAWRRNLETGVALRPGHLSCYQLTVHARTGFGLRAARGQLVEHQEAAQAEFFELTHGFLADAGWPAYEVSNFAAGPGHQSRHNRKYWDHTPYLGLGPSAHSLSMEHTSPSTGRRSWNVARTAGWERRIASGERPVDGEEALGPGELALEALMLGLRTTAGIDLDAFTQRYAVDLAGANVALLKGLVDEGRAVVGPDAGGRRRLWLTPPGLAVADGLAAAFALPAG